jgi:CHAD domain-containing protein
MQPVSHWIAALRTALPLAARDGDRDAVHDLRVACGRLAVWLRLSRRTALREDLRWLRHRAAPLRDVDVIEVMPEARRIADELAVQRLRAQRELALAARSSRTAGLLRALPLLPELDEDDARRELGTLARRARRAARALARGEAPLDDLHRLRRRLRALRYAREWLEEPTDDIKREQDELGRCNDRVVLLRTLRELAHDDATTAELADELERELEQRAGELRRRWSDAEIRDRVTRGK